MTLHEFDIIEKFFTKQSVKRSDVALGIGDDCALVETPDDQQLAITTDTLVAGRHFLPETKPYDIGYRAVAVNLSDLAAMGATPAWITAACTFSDANETWLNEFSRGLLDLAKRYNVQLIGGNISSGPLSITLSAYGFVPKNQALTRAGAKPGDLIYVTNHVGDAALGLAFLQKKIDLPEEFRDTLINRLNRPEPRIEIGEKLRGIAHAAIDISDGLAADLNHILEKSQVGADIFVDQLPLSDALKKSVSAEQAIAFALNGGDDYELCFTVPKEKQALLNNQFTCIGVITKNTGLKLKFTDGKNYEGKIHGFQHF